MEFEQLKSKFEEGYNGLIATVTESFKQLFNKEISFEVAVDEEPDLKKLFSATDFPFVHIRFSTKGVNQYQHWLVLPTALGVKLFAWMIQEDEEESLTDEHLEGLSEGANQIFGQLQAATEGEDTSFTVEDLKLEIVETAEKADAEIPAEKGLRAVYNITVSEESFSVFHYIWGTVAAEEAEETKQAAENQSVSGEGMESENVSTDDLSLVDIPTDDVATDDLVGVHPADFDAFTTNGNGNGQPRNMDMLMDVGLKVLVELGRKTMVIRDILKLGKGSVVELDKAAGEPLEIFVNGRKLAEGEVVVVDDHFGIRITQLAGPVERIKSLE